MRVAERWLAIKPRIARTVACVAASLNVVLVVVGPAYVFRDAWPVGSMELVALGVLAYVCITPVLCALALWFGLRATAWSLVAKATLTVWALVQVLLCLVMC